MSASSLCLRLFSAFGQDVTLTLVALVDLPRRSARRTPSASAACSLLAEAPVRRKRGVLALGEIELEVLTGTSGTVLNVLDVIPGLLMNVLPVKSTRTPSPWRTTIKLGNASPPCETKYTGPDNPTGNNGVLALHDPHDRRRGTIRGVRFERCGGARFLQRRQPRGSCFGSSTLTERCSPRHRPTRGIRELRVETRTIRLARPPGRRDRERGFERQAPAARRRERARDMRDGLFGAGYRGSDLLRLAARRVEHEPRPVDIDRHALQTQRDTEDDLRQRVTRDRQRARFRVRRRSAHAPPRAPG